MKVEIPSHQVERLLWLQHELKTQDSHGLIHPLFTVTAGEKTLATFLTKFMVLRFIASEQKRIAERLQVEIREGADKDPELVLVREMLLDLDLSEFRSPEPKLVKAFVPTIPEAKADLEIQEPPRQTPVKEPELQQSLL